MTWTYDEALASNRDKVRSLVQDTDDSDPLLTDEIISFVLTENGNHLYRTAAQCCRMIALKLGRELSLSDPAMAWDADEKFNHYQALAEQYELQSVSAGTGGVFAGGISIVDKQAREADTDRVSPAFGVGSHRSPGSLDTLVSDYD